MNEFVKEFRNELKQVAGSATEERRRLRQELSNGGRQLKNMMTAIKDGIRTSTTLAELEALEARQAQLTELLSKPSDGAVIVPSDLAAVYHEKVANLSRELDRGAIRTEAADALRSVIRMVQLTPKKGRLSVDVELSLATNGNRRAAQPTLTAMERVKGIEPSS